MKPLCIDLYAGLGGWAEGFLAEGYNVIGFDIERHDYGTGGYPGQLVIQDVLTLHGSQYRGAAVIVASPPCQKYSYMAMPWTRAKKLAAWYQEDETRIVELNALFNSCFRIAAEAGVPLIVENVRGAIPWVGQSRWHYGSFHLWGDVPALMPITTRLKHTKNAGGSWFNVAHNTTSGVGKNPVHELAAVGVKNRDVDGYERDHPVAFGWKAPRTSSKSDSRKAASAQIAKIPFPLARWIAKCFKPEVLTGN